MRIKVVVINRSYRIIDFKRNKVGVPATVTTIEYDPNRTAFIALLNYADGEKRYVIAQNGLKVGQTYLAGDEVAPEIGNCMPLREHSIRNYHFLY